MSVFQTHRRGFVISTDPTRLDVPAIHSFLTERSYWAQGRTLETVRRAIENSLCFGVYALPQDETGLPFDAERQAAYWKSNLGDYAQIGLARVVTDYATFAWVCDVFIHEDFRGHGLGKWLIMCVIEHPVLASVRRMLLATRDAHTLYQQYGGFEPLPNPDRWMIRTNSDAR